MEDFWQRFVEDEISSLIVSLVLILSAFLLKNILAKFVVVRIIAFILVRKNKEIFPKFDQHKKAMFKPFGFFIQFLLLYFSTFYIPKIDEVYIWERGDEKFYLTEFSDIVFLSLIFFGLFWGLIRLIDFIFQILTLKAEKTESKFDDQILPFFKELLKFVIISVGVLLLLSTVFSVNIGALVAGLGIGGIAIALAAKESLENLIGSFTVFADKPFFVGDFVNINGLEGTVEKVGFRSTHLRTLGKSLVSIPNKYVTNSSLENLTMRNFRRTTDEIRIALDTSPQVIELLVQDMQEMLNAHPKTNQDCIVNYDSMKDSALIIKLLYYIEMVDYRLHCEIKSEINLNFLRILRKNKVKLAIPVRTFLENYYKVEK